MYTNIYFTAFSRLLIIGLNFHNLGNNLPRKPFFFHECYKTNPSFFLLFRLEMDTSPQREPRPLPHVTLDPPRELSPNPGNQVAPLGDPRGTLFQHVSKIETSLEQVFEWGRQYF